MLRRLILVPALAAAFAAGPATPASADLCFFLEERLYEVIGWVHVWTPVPVPMYPRGACIPIFVDTPPIELPPIG